MVPDIEREWIAEETRNAPHPSRWFLGAVILLLLIGLAVWLWLVKC